MKNALGAHLDDVGESYFEHFGHAIGFSWRMVLGGLACGVHAMFPFLFENTGSECIRMLHDRMVVNRRNLSKSAQEQGARREFAQAG